MASSAKEAIKCPNPTHSSAITPATMGVCLWQVADALGINESSLSRLLRYELPDEKSREIIAVIDHLSTEVMRGA